MAAIIEHQGLAGVTVESNYELTVEDAAAIADHDAVVFVDASLQGEEPFTFVRLATARGLSFSSHALEPSAVLALAHDLFDSSAPGFLMGIRGYEFDGFGERLSNRAEINLAVAAQFLLPILRDRTLSRVERAAAAEEEHN
jgi:hydrogenase maturation protease